MKRVKLEFWADSFHEGFWACEQLTDFFPLKKVEYILGFIPVFLYELNSETELEIQVFGSYKNWTPLSQKIKDLIDWGKPDLIAYDPSQETILFAVEETAAVPTGNQALQRCERMYGSLRFNIPFWYLIGEYGLHLDGGVRRDSIWPTVLAIKLGCMKNTPCMVLHYSDMENPEDYSVGGGMKMLFESAAKQISIYFETAEKEELKGLLTDQFEHMLSFLDTQWRNLVSYVPKVELIKKSDTPQVLAEMVISKKKCTPELLGFLNWGKTETLPKDIYNNISSGGYIKKDELVINLEKIIDAKRGYTLSSNAGSRPQSRAKVIEWIAAQKRLFGSNRLSDAKFNISINAFPPSPTGVHVTTAKNVFYLMDEWSDVQESLQNSFARLSSLDLEIEKPIFFYISNSLKPGRIFGDPFTGQLAAYSNIFCLNLNGEKERISVAYYPHQVHTQLFNESGDFRENKGIAIMRELLDYGIFHGGVLVNFKANKII